MDAVRVAEEAMAAWGVAQGATLPAGAVVAISGPLGAGKTTLVRALARGLGVVEPVTSPTFALVHRYEGARGPVFHVDAYRLAPKDAPDLAFDDMLREPGVVVLVEWPERLGGALPPPTHAITLADADGGASRVLTVA